ncbi:MAG: cyclase family protein [Bacteroidota bacterium]
MTQEIRFSTVVYLLSIGLLLLTTTAARAQQKWGTEDQRGAANYITETKVVEAAKLIAEGKIYELGHIYEANMPLGGRLFHLNTISSPPSKSSNSFVYNTDFFAGHIGQVGTQFDAFGHFGYRGDGPMKEDMFYNGFTGSEVYSSTGLKNLGVEHAKPFFTRGVLIDVADYKGVQRLEPGYEITEEDIKGSLEKQGTSIKEGDVVLIRTGHSQLWDTDGAAYYNWKAEPGIGTSAGKWLAEQKIVIMGADNFAVEVIPFAKAETKWPVHLMMLKEYGVHLLESLNLEGLYEDQVYEFAFMFSPLPIKGATGSPGNPIAIK